MREGLISEFAGYMCLSFSNLLRFSNCIYSHRYSFFYFLSQKYRYQVFSSYVQLLNYRINYRTIVIVETLLLLQMRNNCRKFAKFEYQFNRAIIWYCTCLDYKDDIRDYEESDHFAIKTPVVKNGQLIDRCYWLGN